MRISARTNSTRCTGRYAASTRATQRRVVGATKGSMSITCVRRSRSWAKSASTTIQRSRSDASTCRFEKGGSRLIPPSTSGGCFRKGILQILRILIHRRDAQFIEMAIISACRILFVSLQNNAQTTHLFRCLLHQTKRPRQNLLQLRLSP